MGIIEGNFKKFYENIQLTPTQKEDAIAKYNGVCEKLHNQYYGNKYDGSTKLLFGSYGKRTNIRPPRDVDVLFKIPKEVFERYDSHESNGQSQLLQDIRTILAEKYSTTDKISAWGKVVLVQFKDGTHNIELLPAYEQQNGTFLIPNSENGGSWEIFNPKEGMDRISQSDDETNGLTRKLIRMLKKWVEEANVEIRSFQLEDCIVNFLTTTDVSLQTQNIITSFFIWLKQGIPKSELSKAETALTRSTNAIEYEKKGEIERALDEWIKIFGNFFPKNTKEIPDELITTHKYNVWKSKYPSSKEKYLDKDFGISFNLTSSYFLKIDATVPPPNGFRTTSLVYYLTNRLRLLKFKGLTFSVIGTNVPKPFDIYWKVRNYGDDAAGDLRGEITKDDGSRSKLEHTKYCGIHTVECFCVKNNQCVAYTLIEVPIGNE